MRFGRILLSAGASSYRVKASMARMARAVGIDEHRASVSFSDIATTSFANNTFRTEIFENRTFGVNADRIERLKALSHKLRTDMAAEQLDEELDLIESTPPLYGPVVNALASGIACAGFCFLNKGGPWECLAVAIAATVGQAMRRMMLHRKMNHFAVWLLCGVIGTLFYIGSIEAMGGLGWLDPTHNQAGVVSAILFLIPGFPMVTALLDFVRMDFPSALTRGSYVFAVMASAGIAVWAVSYTLGWNLNAEVPYHLPFAALAGLRLLSSFIAAWGFAILFNTPWKICACAATTGAIVNTVRFAVIDAKLLPWHAAVAIAALLIGLIAAAIASRTYYSRVSLSVPAVVIMIPGVPFYRALTAMNDGLTSQAINQVVEVLFVITAIGIGLAVSRMLTDRGWIIDTPTNTLPTLESSSRHEIR